MTSLSDSGAPTFREPWQAKAFAIVVLLHRQGRFEWDEWVQVLSGEITACPQQPSEDPDAAYHRQFLVALERIVAALGIANTGDQLRRKDGMARRLHQHAARPCSRAGRCAPCSGQCRLSRSERQWRVAKA
jgi:nitrile hydratase accessory protein